MSRPRLRKRAGPPTMRGSSKRFPHQEIPDAARRTRRPPRSRPAGGRVPARAFRGPPVRGPEGRPRAGHRPRPALRGPGARGDAGTVPGRRRGGRGGGTAAQAPAAASGTSIPSTGRRTWSTATRTSASPSAAPTSRRSTRRTWTSCSSPRAGRGPVFERPGRGERRALKQRQPVDITSALLATGFPYIRDRRVDRNTELIRRLLHAQCHDVRRAGSAALDLCHVAAGKLDGYWEMGLRPWDVAAGASGGARVRLPGERFRG